MAKKINFPTNFTTEELKELRRIKKQQDAEDYARKRTEFEESLNKWLLSMVPFNPIVASSVFVEIAVNFFTMAGVKEEDFRCIIDNDIENAKRCQDFLNHNYGNKD